MYDVLEGEVLIDGVNIKNYSVSSLRNHMGVAAHDFISALTHGYDTEVGERGIKLSGGQKQRIALARVFIKDPSLIILDEATSALDNENEKLVQQSINEIGRDKTIIMIAHRLSTISNADTIFVMKNGKMIESGSHQSLLKLNGYYKELYSRQIQVETIPS